MDTLGGEIMTVIEQEMAGQAPELRPLLAALDRLHDALDLSQQRQDKRLAQRIFRLIAQLVAEVDQIVALSAVNGASTDPEVAQPDFALRRLVALRD
jgi:hypothetical protein